MSPAPHTEGTQQVHEVDGAGAQAGAPIPAGPLPLPGHLAVSEGGLVVTRGGGHTLPTWSGWSQGCCYTSDGAQRPPPPPARLPPNPPWGGGGGRPARCALAPPGGPVGQSQPQEEPRCRPDPSRVHIIIIIIIIMIIFMFVVPLSTASSVS